VEVSHADTIYSRVLHVKRNIAWRLIFMAFSIKKIDKQVGLTRLLDITGCYL
jgi:hypothetical protein